MHFSGNYDVLYINDQNTHMHIIFINLWYLLLFIKTEKKIYDY